jgi:hypothetical protein
MITRVRFHAAFVSVFARDERVWLETAFAGTSVASKCIIACRRYKITHVRAAAAAFVSV